MSGPRSARPRSQRPDQPRAIACWTRVAAAAPDGYRRWLTERGLADVQVIVDERRLPVSDELAWLLVTGSGFRATLGKLTPTQVDAVRQRYLDSLVTERVDEIDATTLIGVGIRT